nr:MAG TPA: hypothetical protein [Caudoviricetes sp.]
MNNNIIEYEYQICNTSTYPSSKWIIKATGIYVFF